MTVFCQITTLFNSIWSRLLFLVESFRRIDILRKVVAQYSCNIPVLSVFLYRRFNLAALLCLGVVKVVSWQSSLGRFIIWWSCESCRDVKVLNFQIESREKPLASMNETRQTRQEEMPVSLLYLPVRLDAQRGGDSI